MALPRAGLDAGPLNAVWPARLVGWHGGSAAPRLARCGIAREHDDAARDRRDGAVRAGAARVLDAPRHACRVAVTDARRGRARSGDVVDARDRAASARAAARSPSAA